MARTQEHREVAVGSPLGDDVLLFKSMNAVERLSSLFRYDLELVSEEPVVDFAAIVGQNITLRVTLPDDSTRFFNGYVSRFVQTSVDADLSEYQATVVPWLWFLTRTANCRIFQNKTAPEIIQEVFRDAGFTDFDDALSGSYRQWEYCVQYRETAFNFVSRLMEQEGIYYFFEHENGKHTLVLADAIGAHQPFPNFAEIPYRPEQVSTRIEPITAWKVQQEIQPGAFVHSDFDFKSPKKDLLAKAKVDRPHAASEFEIFDHPGEYTEAADGDSYAKIRIEELQASYEIVSGQSCCRGIHPGCTFKLTEHPRDDQQREYLVTAVSIFAESDDYESSSAEGGEGFSYGCQFNAIDSSQQYRPPRVTPKPLVQGPQTAIVVGKSGEEIWTDEHGRVKVQFHWDRYGQADENASCWVRVSQAWAGNQWGAIYLPRIGQEVIIEFLEGDPDRPIITGRVYNGDNAPPYGLPDEATKSTIKSNSSKGGGGFNEICFEDNKGNEHILVRAEAELHHRAQGDAFEWVGNERHLIVKQDHFDEVQGDKHLTVKGDQNEKIGGGLSQDIGMDLHQKVATNYALETGMTTEIKALSARIEASTGIELKCGGSSIVLTPSAIFIMGGPLVNINSGAGPPVSPVGCSPGAATAPKEAIDSQPGSTGEPPQAGVPPEPVVFSSAATVLKQAAEDGTPFCEECAKAAEARKKSGG